MSSRGGWRRFAVVQEKPYRSGARWLRARSGWLARCRPSRPSGVVVSRVDSSIQRGAAVGRRPLARCGRRGPVAAVSGAGEGWKGRGWLWLGRLPPSAGTAQRGRRRRCWRRCWSASPMRTRRPATPSPGSSPRSRDRGRHPERLWPVQTSNRRPAGTPSELPSTVVDERWRPFPLQVLKAPFHEECAGAVPAGCKSSGRRIGVARLAEEPVAVPTPRALQPNPGCQEPARFAPVWVLDYPAHGRSLTACDRG
jgi:hypothetical protein